MGRCSNVSDVGDGCPLEQLQRSALRRYTEGKSNCPWSHCRTRVERDNYIPLQILSGDIYQFRERYPDASKFDDKIKRRKESLMARIERSMCKKHSELMPELFINFEVLESPPESEHESEGDDEEGEDEEEEDGEEEDDEEEDDEEEADEEDDDEEEDEEEDVVGYDSESEGEDCVQHDLESREGDHVQNDSDSTEEECIQHDSESNGEDSTQYESDLDNGQAPLNKTVSFGRRSSVASSDSDTVFDDSLPFSITSTPETEVDETDTFFSKLAISDTNGRGPLNDNRLNDGVRRSYYVAPVVPEKGREPALPLRPIRLQVLYPYHKESRRRAHKFLDILDDGEFSDSFLGTGIVYLAWDTYDKRLGGHVKIGHAIRTTAERYRTEACKRKFNMMFVNLEQNETPYVGSRIVEKIMHEVFYKERRKVDDCAFCTLSSPEKRKGHEEWFLAGHEQVLRVLGRCKTLFTNPNFFDGEKVTRHGQHALEQCRYMGRSVGPESIIESINTITNDTFHAANKSLTDAERSIMKNNVHYAQPSSGRAYRNLVASQASQSPSRNTRRGKQVAAPLSAEDEGEAVDFQPVETRRKLFT